jgi:NDP-sugar pyrophosphorylase family protein
VGAAAILLLGTSLPSCTVAGCPIERVSTSHQTLGGVPLACLDILGSSPAQRTMERLARAGVTSFIAIVEAGIACAGDGRLLKPERQWKFETRVLEHESEACNAVATAAEQLFSQNADYVFLVTLGGYVEFMPEEMLKFSRDHHDASVRLHDGFGAAGVWLLSAGCAARSAEADENYHLREQAGAKTYFLDGYVNRLLHPRDVRRMVRDMFQARCNARPGGREIKPGTWVEESAEVHRQARIVAPAYIGRESKVAAATLITRSSSVEECCTVDYGTVVEDASILADTYVGMGLDVTHAVVSGTTLVHLHQNLALDIYDEVLIGKTLQPGLRRMFRRHAQPAFKPTFQEEKQSHAKGAL